MLIAKVSHYELIIKGRVKASHADNLMRIHWPESHSAHGARGTHPIGRDLSHTPIGQGFSGLPVWQRLILMPIGLGDVIEDTIWGCAVPFLLTHCLREACVTV
jgi:hypothetical protein